MGSETVTKEQSSSSQISFPEMECSILDRWQKKDIFKQSIVARTQAYSFYDGPPFATGLPHYGHLLASTLKDIVPRYYTMKGFRVERRWGWDCHGLPIEQEIDKKHQFKSGEEIERFGIDKYNEECRSIVLRFAEEWKQVINRLGRWVDFEDRYMTMDRNFMESVWWVFRQLWDKGLVYRGFKTMQFSTALGTPLSNFEATSNYQEVQDPAITISFPLIDDPSTSFLAWTTTPWTLPSNLALAVGPEIAYVTVEDEKAHKYILAESLVSKYFKEGSYKVLKTQSGKDLVGRKYAPLFDYFSHLAPPHFTVVEGHHVTTEDGTGIVHTAPGHGEEDFEIGKNVGLQVVCPVDSHGKFKEQVKDYNGEYVKDADKKIIADLKSKGRLFRHDTLNHRYAFCPRTDTPLISLAVQSWFISVEKIKADLAKNNSEQTSWVPEHLRDGRFGKWLENARDWLVSRNRYWGNPLPIWEAFEEPLETRECFCVGSIEELEKLSGKKLPDIHSHYLSDIIIEKNGKKFRRVPEVLDCWFESGSMPYAQYHYPFEKKEKFEKEFPADFIAEGLDQTRGWFYTLSVLGTILFQRIPFKNVVVNGMILAEDGKKMSKRLKNYPDPSHIMNEYGADALRLYLIDSPVIRAEELRFSEKGVKEIVRKVLLKLWNAYSFFESYAEIDKYESSPWTSTPQSKNILDRWIISRMQSLLKKIETEMQAYHLYNVVPATLSFIEELTNTYIRLNRARFWGEGFSEDKKSAFDTLHYILFQFSKVLAPFAPFIADHLYLKLTQEKSKESVHLEDYPISESSLIDEDLENGVTLLEEAIVLGRNLREQNKIKVKIPLKEVCLVHRLPQILKSLKSLEDYLKIELNVKNVSYHQEEEKFVHVQVKPNASTLGPRAGKQMKQAMTAISKLTSEDLNRLDAGEKIELFQGFEISAEDIRINREPVAGAYAVNASPMIAIGLDLQIERDQELEGLAREIVSRVQNLRKDSGLQLENRIRLQVQAEGDLKEAAEKFQSYISEQCLAEEYFMVDKINLPHESGKLEIDGHFISLGLDKLW